MDLSDTWIAGTKPLPLNCGEATVVALRYHPWKHCLKRYFVLFSNLFAMFLVFANVKMLRHFVFNGKKMLNC